MDFGADFLEERFLVHEADEPLAGRDVFDGGRAFFVVADDVFDGTRIGLERRFGFDVGTEHGLCGGSGTGDQLNHFGSDIVESESGDLVVEELGAARV